MKFLNMKKYEIIKVKNTNFPVCGSALKTVLFMNQDTQMLDDQIKISSQTRRLADPALVYSIIPFLSISFFSFHLFFFFLFFLFILEIKIENI